MRNPFTVLISWIRNGIFFTTGAPTVTAGKDTPDDYYVTMSVHKNGKYRRLCISIPDHVAAAAGLFAGDRVFIYYNPCTGNTALTGSINQLGNMLSRPGLNVCLARTLRVLWTYGTSEIGKIMQTSKGVFLPPVSKRMKVKVISVSSHERQIIMNHWKVVE